MAKSTSKDILSLIEADHRHFEQLFADAEKADNKKLYECFNQIFQALTLHARTEELVFYSAMQEYEETKKYVEKAEKEHEEAKVILEEIKELKPGELEFQTKINELKKAVQHHVKEEENQIFNAIRKCMNDEQLTNLGRNFQETKAKLEPAVQAAMLE
ncbi:MAG: hemerythrin domain-containing protein [Fischerella sp.]|nr:hemerythrin domain-containing protein [Fischerella sp.]